MNDTQRRVSVIHIRGLFGLFNHDVVLRPDNRITILHGPNGVGKTALLRMVTALFAGRPWELARYPFEEFSVLLDDGTGVVIGPNPGLRVGAPERARNKCVVTVQDGRGGENSSPLDLERPDLVELVSRFEASTHWLSRLSADRWLDTRTGEELATIDVWNRYMDQILPSSVRESHRPSAPEPEILREFRSRVVVHLIETERLLRPDAGEEWRVRRQARHTPAIRESAQDLQRRVTQALATYAQESQVLDQTFPQRLLTAVSGPQRPRSVTSNEETRSRLDKLESRSQELRSIGLLEERMASRVPRDLFERLAPENLDVMHLYVEDTERKLGKLDDIATRVRLLLRVLNEKFKHKSVSLHRERGFVVHDAEKRLLELEALSSGEQHEVVLFYDLLFRVKPNTLVLIDEPELSLHLVWQKRFLPELFEVVSAAGFDALVATHSPFIVGDRTDLMVELTDET